MSLLDGMDKFGLGHLKDIESDKAIIEKIAEKADDKPAITKQEKVEETETDFIYEKMYECPVCDSKIRELVVKSSKTRMVSTDKDLKPNYRIIDPLKYDVIHCNKCGYAVLSRYYAPLAKPHKEMLKKTIAMRYKPTLEIGSTISYSQAFSRYQLTLANAMCRQAKSSELGIIYLKLAWLVREMQKHKDELPTNKVEFKEENLVQMEDESLKNAKDYFVRAVLEERPPIAGMNEVTINYLLAVLCMRFKEYDVASKMISDILASSAANSNQKDKARDLKEELRNALIEMSKNAK